MKQLRLRIKQGEYTIIANVASMELTTEHPIKLSLINSDGQPLKLNLSNGIGLVVTPELRSGTNILTPSYGWTGLSRIALVIALFIMIALTLYCPKLSLGFLNQPSPSPVIVEDWRQKPLHPGLN